MLHKIFITHAMLQSLAKILESHLDVYTTFLFHSKSNHRHNTQNRFCLTGYFSFVKYTNLMHCWLYDQVHLSFLYKF